MVAEVETVSRDFSTLIREHIEFYDRDWAWERRREYLQELMVTHVEAALMLVTRQERAIEENNLIALTLITERLQGEIRSILGLQRKLHENPAFKNRGRADISRDMIDRAKAFPFQELYPFKRNMAPCPFHADRTPSLSLKDNRARCFSCGRTWDTVGFVMELEGLSFPAAVRRLQ